MSDNKADQDFNVPKASSPEESAQMSSVNDEQSEHRHGRRRAAARERRETQYNSISQWAKSDHGVDLNPRNVRRDAVQAYGDHLDRKGERKSVLQTGNNVRSNTSPEVSVGRKYLKESESAVSRFFQRVGNLLTGKGFNTNFEVEEKHAQEVAVENQKAATPHRGHAQAATNSPTAQTSSTPAQSSETSNTVGQNVDTPSVMSTQTVQETSPLAQSSEASPLAASALPENSVSVSSLAMPPEENSALMHIDDDVQEITDDDLSQYQSEDYQEYIESQKLAQEQEEQVEQAVL